MSYPALTLRTVFGGASLVSQLVKNLPAMQETPVQFLGPQDPLEKDEATNSSILGYLVGGASPVLLEGREVGRQG